MESGVAFFKEPIMQKTSPSLQFSTTRSCTFALALFTVLTVTLPAQAAPDPLEGKWNVSLVSDDNGKITQDVWTFHIDKVSSVWAIKQGFKEPAPCDIDTRGGQSRSFFATAKNGKAELKWTGTAALGEMTGTLTWTKADGATTSFTYKATKAEK